MGANSTLKLVQSSIPLYMDIISSLKHYAHGMLSNQGVEEALDTLRKLKPQLNEEERKSTELIINTAKQVRTASMYANTAVQNILGLVNTLTAILESGIHDRDKILEAGKLYKQKIGTLLPSINLARDQMQESVTALYKVGVSINDLMHWCERKKGELEIDKATNVAKERGAAYGGASAATSGVAIACAAIPVFGWIAALVAIPVTAAVSFGVAAGVAEGCTIPQLKEIYDNGIKDLSTMSTRFADFAEETKEMTADVTKKTSQLEDIARIVEEGNDSADRAYYLMDKFKEDLHELQGMCRAYLEISRVV